MRTRLFLSAAVLALLPGLAAPAAEAAPGHNLVGPKSMAALIKVAGDADSIDQLRALTDLAAAKVNAPEFLKILPGVYHGAKDATVQAAALWALAAAGPKARDAAAPVLQEALKHSSPLIRATALEAQTRLGLPLGKAPGLARDPDLGVRLAALDAVRGHQAQGEWLDELARAAAEDVPAARRRAVEALRGAEPEGQAEKLRKLYRGALGDADLTVARAACANLAAAAARPADFAALAPEVEKLTANSWTPLAAAAVGALGRLAPDKALARLPEWRRHARPEVRQAALGLAGELLKDAAAVAALPEHFADPEADVRRAAALACRRCQERGVIDRAALEDLAKKAIASDKADAQVEGLWLLATLGSQAGFPDAMRLTESADERLPRALLWLIGESKYAAGEEFARKAATDKKRSELTRSHAATALGKLKAKGSAPALCKMVREIRTVQNQKVWGITGRLRHDAVCAIIAIDVRAHAEALETTLYSQQPEEEPDNVTVICQWLTAIKWTNELEDIPGLLSKYSPHTQKCLAEMYEKLSGKKVGVELTVDRDALIEPFIVIDE